MKKTFTGFARTSVKEIHALSREYNGKKGKHSSIMMKLIKEHTAEVEELYKKKDPHFLIELGDLLVLCLEFFEEYGKDPDEIMGTCYNRYRDKLSQLLCKKKVGEHGPGKSK